MLNYIEWIFSGIGTAILSRFWPEKYKSRINNKVKGNNNKVAGGSIINGSTLSEQSKSNLYIENDIEGDNNIVSGQNINQ